MVPALCAAVLCVGPDAGAPKVYPAVHLAASAQAPERQQAADEPAEDLVPVPVGRPYVWPSGIGLVVAAPTASAGRGGSAVVSVRTTVFNESGAPYDLRAVLGPTARYDGRDVPRLTDSRYATATAEHIVAPGRQLGYETTFPAGAGRLTLQYRTDFRFEAVVVGDP